MNTGIRIAELLGAGATWIGVYLTAGSNPASAAALSALAVVLTALTARADGLGTLRRRSMYGNEIRVDLARCVVHETPPMRPSLPRVIHHPSGDTTHGHELPTG